MPADGCGKVFVCDPFLANYRRRLREAARRVVAERLL